MTEINKPVENIAKAWGVQEIKDTDYRLIKYHLRKDYEDGAILCNCVTGYAVFLDKKEVSVIEKLPCRYNPSMDELIKNHFLVPTDYDEYETVNNLRKALKLLDNIGYGKDIYDYMILPTTACNARCFYCFEAGCKTVTMTDEIADKTADFIKSHHGNKPVIIEWFGGEPTVGAKYIDRISQALKDSDIDYSSSMTSNGYLFDEEMVKKAKLLWNLKGIQITLDGTEEIYNKVKSYVGVKDNPYKRVLRNIGLLLENDIHVTVRLNLDRHNSDDLFKLVDELCKKFGKYKNISIYSKKLSDDKGYEPLKHSGNDEEMLTNAVMKLQGRIHNGTIDVFSGNGIPRLRYHSCMADNDNAVLIHPSGMLGKCPDQVEKNFGNIFDGFIGPEKLSNWSESFELEKCRNCQLYPGCVRLKECPGSDKCAEYYLEERLYKYDCLLDMKYKSKIKSVFERSYQNEKIY